MLSIHLRGRQNESAGRLRFSIYSVSLCKPMATRAVVAGVSSTFAIRLLVKLRKLQLLTRKIKEFQTRIWNRSGIQSTDLAFGVQRRCGTSLERWPRTERPMLGTTKFGRGFRTLRPGPANHRTEKHKLFFSVQTETTLILMNPVWNGCDGGGGLGCWVLLPVRTRWRSDQSTDVL